MDSSTPDGSSVSCKELQSYLKAWNQKASGSTAALECDTSPPSAVGNSKPVKSAPEKRAKRFRPKPTVGIQQRIDRAGTQRLYLVERSDIELRECKFVVLGSTGNVYEVKVGKIPHCSCPDHAKGNLCKHILFVMLKVIGLDSLSPLVYQAAYLESELDFIFNLLASRRVGGSVMANETVKQTYASLQNGEDVKGAERKSLDDDSDCPICFDIMKQGSSLTYCRATCGANFHDDCVQRWLCQNRHNATCPNCRQPWDDGEKKIRGREGYTNLGNLQGQSRKRDDSTYSEWYGATFLKRRRQS